MSDFFLNLARAAVEPGATLRPRLASRFEPLAPPDSEVRSVESWTRSHADGTSRPQPEAAPAPARLPPDERVPVARAAVAAPRVEPPGTANAERSSTPVPPESHESALETFDDRAPSLALEAQGEPDVAAAPPEARGSIVLRPERGERAPVPANGLLPDPASALLSARPEATLLPRVPIRSLPVTSMAQPSPPSSEPTVHVTIGSIEIRAVHPTREGRARKAEKPSGIMSLDEYVARRQGGRP